MSRAARALLLTLLVTSVAAAQTARPAPSSEALQAIEAAYEAVYNLDYTDAEVASRRAVALAPDDSRTHRALAGILWLDMLFERGGASIDHYLGGVSKTQQSRPQPPSLKSTEFKRELARAIELAEARVAADPRDVNARYELGVAYGLQASYFASMEGSMTSAFRSGKRAFDAQEYVLDRDPGRVAAGLIVGSYRYAVSALNLPTRMFAYMAGFGGGKERGIEMVEKALADADTRVQAKTALVLIFTREGRHLDAMRLLSELERAYPRNRLFTLEYGAAAIRAGRMAEAQRTLERGLAALSQDSRRKMPGERAYWLYKLALSRLGQNRRLEAAETLSAAMMQNPADWVRGRIHLALGQAADLAGDRNKALGEYRTAKRISEEAGDPWCTVRADRFLKQRFVLPTGGG